MKQYRTCRQGHRHNDRPGNRHPYYRRAGQLPRRAQAAPPANRHAGALDCASRKRAPHPSCQHGPDCQRGFSLVEIGIVLLIISLVVIGVYSKATSIGDEAKVQRAVDDTLLLLSKATAYRTDRGGYSGANITALNSGGYSTAPITDGDNENPWGRDYVLGTTAGGALISLTIDAGSTSLCARLVSTLNGLIYNQESITCAGNVVTVTAR